MLKLGTFITDKASGIKGMLTMFNTDGDNDHYQFQPKGLNPKTKLPLDTYWINKSRIQGGEEDAVILPIHLVGTQGIDIATGFKGTIISIIYHLNGCIHVEVKAKGIDDETGEAIKAQNFDIRRMKGDKIKPLSGKVLEESKVKAPSPGNYSSIFNH